MDNKINSLNKRLNSVNYNMKKNQKRKIDNVTNNKNNHSLDYNNYPYQLQ